jgi:alkylhydroperoxidase family enzyme
MARVPLLDDSTRPDLLPLIEQIKSQRGGKLLNLYKTLLHSPPVAAGWLGLFTAIRNQCTLAARYRELAIMRVAIVNRADYEFRSHIPFALAAGIAQGQLDALPNWQSATVFDEIDRAILGYTDAMTSQIQVPKALFDAVRERFNDRECVELTATIAGYNLVSRFLEAIQVDHD